MSSSPTTVKDSVTLARKKTVASTPDGPAKNGSVRTRHYAGPVSGSWIWVVPSLIFVVGIVFIPTIAGSVYAFTNWNGFSTPTFVGFSNFISIFENPLTRTALLNTLGIGISFVVITNILGLLFAVGLNRTLKSRHFLRVVLFAPVVLSPLAVSYVWQYIFQFEGPLNAALKSVGLGAWQKAWLGDPQYAIYTIIIVMVWQHIGLVMVIYLAGLANVPQELEEAAAIDGAGTWKRFIHIVVFQIRPSIVIACVLMLIQGLKVFDQVIGLTGGGPDNATETLATQVWEQTFTNGLFGYGDALALILTVIVILFSLLQIALLRGRREAR